MVDRLAGGAEFLKVRKQNMGDKTKRRHKSENQYFMVDERREISRVQQGTGRQ